MELVQTIDKDPRKIQPAEASAETGDESKHNFNYPIIENYAEFVNKWIQEIARGLMLQGVDMNDPATAFDVIQTVKDVTDRQIMFYLLDRSGVKDISEILTDDYMNKVKSSFKVQKAIK